MSAPTQDRFRITLQNLPHGWMTLSPTETVWFEKQVNSDLRQYYKDARYAPTPEAMPIGRSGITVGELALFVLNQSHRKRCRRY